MTTDTTASFNFDENGIPTFTNNNKEPLQPYDLPSDFPIKLLDEHDRLLRQPSVEVTNFREAHRLSEHMKVLMKAKLGLGLAAPQVGHHIRMILVGTHPINPTVMINPVIVIKEGETTEQEGCLSFPQLFAKVKRANKVVVEYQDTSGMKCTLAAQGLMAVCIQHEVDHLNGILFIDHMSKPKRDLAERKRKKQR